MADRPGVHRGKAFLHVTRYLRLDEGGGCEMTARPPALRAGQVAMELTIAIPLRLFARPLLTAHVAVPEDAAMPERLSAEVVQHLKTSIEEATGLEVQVELRPRTHPVETDKA